MGGSKRGPHFCYSSFLFFYLSIYAHIIYVCISPFIYLPINLSIFTCTCFIYFFASFPSCFLSTFFLFSILAVFLDSFLASFLNPPFLPIFLSYYFPSFLPFYLPYFLPSFLSSYFPIFLPYQCCDNAHPS